MEMDLGASIYNLVGGVDSSLDEAKIDALVRTKIKYDEEGFRSEDIKDCEDILFERMRSIEMEEERMKRERSEQYQRMDGRQIQIAYCLTKIL